MYEYLFHHDCFSRHRMVPFLCGHRRIRTFGTYSVRLFSRQVHSTTLPYVQSHFHDIVMSRDAGWRRFFWLFHCLVRIGTSGGTRTHTVPLLRRLPLPIGIQRLGCDIHHSIYTAAFVKSECCGFQLAHPFQGAMVYLIHIISLCETYVSNDRYIFLIRASV